MCSLLACQVDELKDAAQPADLHFQVEAEDLQARFFIFTSFPPSQTPRSPVLCDAQEMVNRSHDPADGT